MAVWEAVRVAGGVRVMLLKDCGKDWPVVRALGGFRVNVCVPEVWLSGLRTLTAAEPAVAMSAAGMLAVTRVALTNVVVRTAPFQRTGAPGTKLFPSAVRGNAGPPAGGVFGVRRGGGGGRGPG